MCDEGWWKGKSPDGNYGLFPSNYVELMPDHGVCTVILPCLIFISFALSLFSFMQHLDMVLPCHPCMPKNSIEAEQLRPYCGDAIYFLSFVISLPQKAEWFSIKTLLES